MADALPALVDTHTHLNHPRLQRRLSEVLARARAAGVAAMLVVGYDLHSSELAVSLAQEHEDLWAAVGIHPHDASAADAPALACLRELARRPRVVAVGETGLDLYHNLSPRAVQVEAFRRHAALAAEVGLPLIVHCRAAEEELLGLLAEEVGAPIIWHCFDGAWEQAERALALGATLGLGGLVVRRSHRGLLRTAAEAPEDRLIVETDSPYLTPETARGRDNEPANLRAVIRRLAELRGVGEQELARATTQTAQRLFKLETEAPVP